MNDDTTIIIVSYYNLSFLSVCLFRICSADYWPIGTKLGRKVRGGSRKDLRLLVSMATNLLPWYPKKGDFSARSGFLLDTTLLMTSWVTLPCQWRHGRRYHSSDVMETPWQVCHIVSGCIGASALIWATWWQEIIFLSVWACESQTANPIGSALVFINRNRSLEPFGYLAAHWIIFF